MDDENIPLLVSEPYKSISNDDDSLDGPSSESDSPLQLGVMIVKDYGTNVHTVEDIIPLQERMTYTWNNINAFSRPTKKLNRRLFSFTKLERTETSSNKQLLYNVNGIAHPGELLVILGSSGSGKTTLLNAITNTSVENVTITGVRCINGIPVTPNNLKGVSAYVQQDDLFIPTLTVKEHLIFQALVRMDRGLSYSQRMRRVEQVITELLLKNCENTRIGYIDKGGISGGEKKRLSFAAEVLTNPQIMFCDEPTSGLDSFMALQVVQALKAMIKTGKTAICTIHQPSSEMFTMFDKIMLLAEGSVAFLGDGIDADIFFRSMEARCPRNYNPADFYVKLLSIVPEKEESCRQAISLIYNTFQKSSLGVKIHADSAFIRPDHEQIDDIWLSGEMIRTYKNSCLAQFRALLWRSWISTLKDPLVVKVRLFQTVIISLLLGILYYHQELNQEGVININGVLFVFLTSMTFQNVFAVVNVFTAEMPIFLREHRHGMYRTDVYFLSKTIAELPFFILIPIVFTSVCYFIIGLSFSFIKFAITCGIVMLVANAALSYGYLISCASNSTSMALTLGAPLIIPFLLFGGYFMNLDSIPEYFRWLSYLSWFRYGNEALMINQWKDVTEIDCPINRTNCPRNGHIVLETYNFIEDDFVLDIVGLLCLIIGFRFLAFLALLVKSRR